MKPQTETIQSFAGINQIAKQGWKLPFFTIWFGQAASLLGSQLVGFALIWHLTETTGSAKVLALASMMEWLPRVFIGPVAGAVVDRLNRRLVMLLADSLTAIATGVLIYLGWSGNLSLWHIYLLMMVRSIGGAFHFPAMTASTSLMVPGEQLSRIQGLNQLLQGLMNIAAPPLGALLVGLLPLHGVLSVDIVTAVIAILTLLLVHIPQPKTDRDPAEKHISLWGDLREGFQYVWRWSGLRKVLGLAVMINAISVPAIILLPLLATKKFAGGAFEVAALQSGFAIGFLAGGLILAVWGGFRRKIITATAGIFGAAVGMALVGVAPANGLVMAVTGIFIAGMMSVLTNGPTFAMLQTVVDENMQGRVIALVISLANAFTPLGLLISGPLAEVNGVQTWFFLTAGAFIFAGIFILRSEDVRTIEDQQGKPIPGQIEKEIIMERTTATSIDKGKSNPTLENNNSFRTREQTEKGKKMKFNTNTKTRLRKVAAWLLRIILALVVLAGGIFLWASLSTGSSLVARGIMWGDSDAGDLERFPTREMQASTTPQTFEPAAIDPLTGIPITADAIQAEPMPFETFMEKTNTTAFIVLHGDQLLYEGYFNGAGRDTIQTSFSAAKAFTATLVGIAIEEGLIDSLDDPITAYLPELIEQDPRFAEITIRHLITMQSGLRWERSDSNPFSDDFVTYYSIDLRETAFESEIVSPPGEEFLYNDYNPLLLGMILERATGMSVSDYTQSRLWQPMGAEGNGSWSLDSNASGFEKMFVGVNGRAIDLAKLGWLFLNEGKVGETQVVPQNWVIDVNNPNNAVQTNRGKYAEGYQYYWFLDRENDAYYAEGDKCQFIYVYPRADLVLARFGTDCGNYVFGIGWMVGIAEYLETQLIQ